MATNAERVLGAILNVKNPRRDLLAQAVVRLNDEHFPVDTHKNVFRLLKQYFDLTGDIMPYDVLVSSLQNAGVEAAKVLAYAKTYESIANMGVEDSEFKWSVNELRGELARRETGVAITEAMEILERGYEDRKGNYRKGHNEAREYLMSRLHEIDKAAVPSVAPEGNIFGEADSIWKAYTNARDGVSNKGILTGIQAIDSRTEGYQRGELILVCAYAGQGKSQLSTQSAWHCAVEQKKNVFFATSETLRDQVMRRIVARHSRLPQFDHPINSADLKKGTLSPEDEKVLADVLEDWRYNSSYGKLNVVQIPAHSKLSYVENRLREYGNEYEIELCIIDYLALLTAETKRSSEREEFNEIIRGAKGIAQGFMDGRGVPVLSPWQITRDAYEHAMRNGRYTKASLSDTSEAEKSADQIIALIREEGDDRVMNLQFLKMRDDEIPPITEVAIDFRNTYIGAHLGPVSLAAGVTNTSNEMNSLLNQL